MADRIGYNGSDKWKIKATELLNEGGGGSEVIPNPQGQATDTLDTISIDGTVYSIAGGGGNLKITNIIGTSSAWSKYQESNMSITWANDEIDFVWNGGNSIGGNIVKIVPIPASAVKIKFKIRTGTAYDASAERFKLGIGVRTTYTTSVVIDSYNVFDWLAFKNFSQTNSEWVGELDLSGVNVSTYLYILGHGWNAEIIELNMVEDVSSEIIVHTTTEWQGLTSLVSKKGGIYVWSDYKTENGVDIPAMKIGDGLAYVVDLPFATQAITLSQIQSWNNKVSARISGENLILEN